MADLIMMKFMSFFDLEVFQHMLVATVDIINSIISIIIKANPIIIKLLVNNKDFNIIIVTIT